VYVIVVVVQMMHVAMDVNVKIAIVVYSVRNYLIV